MSTTELVTAEKILSDLQAKFGMVDETWGSSYTKTAQSKNITLQEWNRVVEKVSANSSSTEALYTALEDSLALFGNLEETVNTFDDRISTNKTTIENEVKRATAKESELGTAITNETTRATAKEDTLERSIGDNAKGIASNTTAIEKNASDISDLQTTDATFRSEFNAFVDKVNDLLDSDDATLDEMHEIVAYIKNNASLISQITNSKVNVADIIDRLDVKATDKPLSAAQGVVLRGLIASLDTALKSETTAREAAITEEANARSLADAVHTTAIAGLKTRLDSLDLPVIQHSLYEHSILVTTRDPNAPRPYVFLRCSIFNRISERLGLSEVLECLHSTLGKGTTLKTFSGYVEYNANSGVAVAEVVDLTTALPTEILKYELSEDGNSYICVGFADGYDYTDILMDVVIPSEYNGKPVTAIAGNAFMGQYIKSCVVPPTVTDIGHWAFGMNETLEYVHIPSSVTSIGDNAFTYSSNVNIYCEAAEQPSGWSSTWNSDNRPVTWSSPVPDTALYVRYYDTSGVRNLLKISSSKISVYDAVSTVAQVSEGGGGVAIIECLELPTQNISTAHLYRTPDGKLHWYDGRAWHESAEKSDLGGWDFSSGKISATGWDDNEAKLSVSSQGIEINRQGTVDRLQFPGTDGKQAVTLATEKDLEPINKTLDAMIEEIPALIDEKIANAGVGSGAFVGTWDEYNAIKDTIPDNTIVIVTDDGIDTETSAILGQAILGKMILGQGA